MFLCTIHDEQPPRSIIAQIAGRELAHLPGPYQQNTRLIEVRKELPGQSHRDMAHRSCTAADAGLAAGALARHEGSAKQRRRNRASEVTVLGSFERLCHLPLYLRLSRYKRMESAGNLKEVRYGFFAGIVVTMGLKLGQRYLTDLAQHTEQALPASIYLRADGV
jgi:hypothetical protein